MGEHRILLVDDEYLVRYSLAKALEGGGREIATAGSAEEALSRIDDAPYDLCFLDVRLPGMYGLQAMELMCRRQPRLKVVVMTASPLTDQQLSLIETYRARFLEKPFDLVLAARLAEEALGAA